MRRRAKPRRLGRNPAPRAAGQDKTAARTARLPQIGHAVGVDLGVTDFAVTSDEQRIPNPRRLERKVRSLAGYQRRMARCQRDSMNRTKAKAKVARAHRKVRNGRADFLHRASTGLARHVRRARTVRPAHPVRRGNDC